jgi:hypothetical protein
MLTHYFSCSGGTSIDSRKSASRHITPNLCFSIRCDMWVTWCILVHPACETLTHYFSCSCGTGTDFRKSALGHVMLNLCFYIWWDPTGQVVHCSVSSGICGSCSAFRCIWGLKCRCTIFHAHVGPIQIPQKVHQDTLRQTCVFHLLGYASQVVHSGVSGAQNIDTGAVSIKSTLGQVTSNFCFCIWWDMRVT